VSTSPLYRSVHTELRDRIVAGRYAPGALLPSERRLVDEFKVSLITIRRAMDELVLDGLVERRQGVGSFVRERARGVVVGMSSFTTDVLTGRLRLVRTLLEDAQVPAPPDVARKLAVQEGSLLRHLVRLDAEGGTPLSVDEVFAPPAVAALISTEMAASPSFLHLWQEKAGLSLRRAEYEVSVQLPDASDRALLFAAADTPLLVTAELIFEEESRPVAWIITRYRGDRTRLRGSFAMGAAVATAAAAAGSAAADRSAAAVEA
jgi:GntR family transcriptional regulator